MRFLTNDLAVSNLQNSFNSFGSGVQTCTLDSILLAMGNILRFLFAVDGVCYTV